MTILKLLANNQFWTVNKPLARATSIEAALFYAEIASAIVYHKTNEVFRSMEEIEEQTTLKRRKQNTARRLLKSKGLIKETRKGTPARIYYKIDEECSKNLLNIIDSQECTSVQSRMYTTYNQECTQSTDKSGQNVHTYNKNTVNKNTERINTMSDSKNPTNQKFLFDVFWDKYAYKVGSKSRCKANFLKLSKKDQQKAMDQIPFYNQWLELRPFQERKQPQGFLSTYLDTDFKALISQERAKSGNNTPQVDLAALRAKLMDLRSKHADVWTKEYDTKIKDNGILKGYRYIERKHPEWIS